ncbi:MAG: 3-phosphoserine/phosphohydroxythreonine transaminase [Spirochaetaceae bacterium]|jgi:phosphoserine aminotransferase|nr:3-phosphoserine/phosphohydroxythreonine transaminase [Spirochaetaceae bacterium]
MERVYNFSPGPSILPLPVLKKASAEMLDAYGSGQSIMEMSHRSKDFKPVIEGAENLLRSLLGIPEEYTVLFLQGGASLQFSMVPINLAGTESGSGQKKAAFVDTGVWAGKAIDEAKKYVDVRVLASSKDKNYSYIPAAPAPEKDDVYYHICLNNTIVGTKWHTLPPVGDVPLVADVSSCILSEPLDVSRFGLLYAGAQKNLGPAGCTVVIIRKDLITQAPSWTPTMLRYDIHAKEKSLYNTPPCWSIYIIYLVLQWISETGGLEAMGERNRKKAGILYDALEKSSLFYSPVEKASRSLMNIPFVIREKDEAKKKTIEEKFLKEAAENGMINLAGHRLVGGLRASIYNAMPLEGVDKLVSFIEKFEKKV